MGISKETLLVNVPCYHFGFLNGITEFTSRISKHTAVGKMIHCFTKPQVSVASAFVLLVIHNHY